MQNEQNKTITKTIRLEEDLCKRIQELAEENERDFSKQIKFMLKKYLEVIK